MQQRLGAMLVCIFAEVDSVDIDRHLSKILPIMLKNLQSAVDSSKWGEFHGIVLCNCPNCGGAILNR